MRTREHFRTAVYPTPFHSRTSAANVLNLWHRWKDYTVPDAYFDVGLEYAALRNACTTFDLSPIIKQRITGPDALPFLNRLVTRDVTRLRPWHVAYCVWCNEEGQVIDDGTLFHLNAGEYWLCSQERQLDWLHASALGFDVSIGEETDQFAALALQGPTSFSVLQSLGVPGIADLRPFAIQTSDFEGTPLMISRTGFTGDLGYELWIDPAQAVRLWDRLFEAGRIHGIKPMGTLALDMSRIEAGFVQAGVDYLAADMAVRHGRTRSPFELDLEWLVDLSKPNFTGRRALLAERQKGSRYRFVKLDVEGNKPAKDAFIYDSRRNVVGTVTSAIWSPAVKASIALASVQFPWGRPTDELYAEIYYQKELKWSRVLAKCRVVERPFYTPPRWRETPPPRC